VNSSFPHITCLYPNYHNVPFLPLFTTICPQHREDQSYGTVFFGWESELMKLQKWCFSFQYCNLINQHHSIFYKHLLLGTDNLRLGRYFNFRQCLSYICMYRMQVLPPPKYHISYKFSQQYIYHIFGHAAQSPFFSPQNSVCFINFYFLFIKYSCFTQRMHWNLHLQPCRQRV